jgi:hypothetical protein
MPTLIAVVHRADVLIRTSVATQKCYSSNKVADNVAIRPRGQVARMNSELVFRSWLHGNPVIGYEPLQP